MRRAVEPHIGPLIKPLSALGVEIDQAAERSAQEKVASDIVDFRTFYADSR